MLSAPVATRAFAGSAASHDASHGALGVRRGKKWRHRPGRSWGTAGHDVRDVVVVVIAEEEGDAEGGGEGAAGSAAMAEQRRALGGRGVWGMRRAK